MATVTRARPVNAQREQAHVIVGAFERARHEWRAAARQVSEAEATLRDCRQRFRDRSKELLDATEALEGLLAELGIDLKDVSYGGTSAHEPAVAKRIRCTAGQAGREPGEPREVLDFPDQP
jgi:hypothetical protein